MTQTMIGGCQCGQVRYELSGAPMHHTLCHCIDCRRSAGAPVVGWMGFPAEALTVTAGAPKSYRSSEHAERQFCATCGTGLFYYNEVVLPGLVDIQSGTLDDPEATAPSAHIQTAERLSWMETAHGLPGFERYPPME